MTRSELVDTIKLLEPMVEKQGYTINWKSLAEGLADDRLNYFFKKSDPLIDSLNEELGYGRS